MWWYIFQTSLMLYIVYMYTTEIAPDFEPKSGIVVFAVLLTYIATIIVYKTLYFIGFVVRSLASYKRRRL